MVLGPVGTVAYFCRLMEDPDSTMPPVAASSEAARDSPLTVAPVALTVPSAASPALAPASVSATVVPPTSAPHLPDADLLTQLQVAERRLLEAMPPSNLASLAPRLTPRARPP